MLNERYCTLCLTHNKRTINIFRTDLQCIYENLANITLTYQTCWMCFICHERLRQCYLLKKLAVKTCSLINNVCENEIDIKFGAFGSLLNLTSSNINIISTLQPTNCNIKTEPGENTEFNFKHTEIGRDGEITNVSEDDKQPSSSSSEAKELILTIEKRSPSLEKYIQTKHTEHFYWRGEATLTTKQIKQELKEEVPDEEIERDRETTNIFEDDKQPSTSSYSYLKDDLLVFDFDHSQDSLKVDRKNYEAKELIFTIEKRSPSLEKYVQTKHTKHFEGRGEATLTTKNIKQELKEERADEGIGRGYEVDISDSCEGRDQTSNAPLDRYKKPYSCDVCLKKFSNKIKLQIHIRGHARVHTGDKPYSCEVCLKKFSQKSYLQKHNSVHMGDKPYSCDVCLKKFLRKDNLQKHNRVHMGDKPYSCDVCLKKFSRKDHLQTHNSVHTGDKPYSCDVCLKKFKQKGHLLKHHSVHTGNKPYSCDVCLKKFSQKTHLQKHNRVHMRDKPYSKL